MQSEDWLCGCRRLLLLLEAVEALLVLGCEHEARVDLCELVAVSCGRALGADTLAWPAAKPQWAMLLLLFTPHAAAALPVLVVSVHPDHC